MSIIYLETDLLEPYPIGTVIVADVLSRGYEESVDTSDDIIGVSYPSSGTNGRICANADGLCFNDFDYFIYGEDLKMQDPLTPNPEWSGSFNPNTSSDPTYTLVCTHGLAPVLSGQVIPSRWKLIRPGTEYDIYLIR